MHPNRFACAFLLISFAACNMDPKAASQRYVANGNRYFAKGQYKNLTNDGIRVLRDLVARRPDSAPFHLRLALALYQNGDRPLAKTELQNTLRLQSTAREQSTIEELLAKVG